MPAFRPDVILYPATEFFPELGTLMVTEDFWWAMWHAAGDSASPESANSIAMNAAKLAQTHGLERSQFPSSIHVLMPAGALAETCPIPLFISRTSDGTPILGVFSDACPDSTNTNNP
jgi:hypothetical protein